MDFINDGGRISVRELNLPMDLKKLSLRQCRYLCTEIRNILISTVSKTGGHLSSNLGVVELTVLCTEILIPLMIKSYGT